MAEQPTTLMPGDTPMSPEHALRPLFATCIAFLIIDSLVVGLRFFTVLRLRKPRLALTWDDYLLIPAYLCLLAIIVIGFGTCILF